MKTSAFKPPIIFASQKNGEYTVVIPLTFYEQRVELPQTRTKASVDLLVNKADKLMNKMNQVDKPQNIKMW